MARLSPKHAVIGPTPGESLESWQKRSRRLEQLFTEQSDALPPTQILGTILKLAAYPSYGVYRVVKEQPLTLQFLPLAGTEEACRYQINRITRQEIVSRRIEVARFNQRWGLPS